MPFNLDSYEPVEDRLREFWADHPDGRIETEMVKGEAGEYIVKASVWREDLGDVLGKVELYRPSATGYAQEQIADRGVNATSALENCETSAIGRALANLGYAAKGKRPSREEMQKSDAAPSSRAQGTASDRSGEGQANPGESGASQTSPEHHFPVDPAVCSHKTASGAWVKWVTVEKAYSSVDGSEDITAPTQVCPKCGTPKVAAMESTTADLGPAK